MTSTDTFRVYTRCRPLNQIEVAYGASKKALSLISSNTVYLTDGATKEHTFQMDGAFSEHTQNSQIFAEAVVPLADNFLNGINSTVFAYGITGAGKSFTMFGKKNASWDDPQAGLIPRTFEYLLAATDNDQNVSLKLSYMEIYNEQVFDLFKAEQTSLQISEDPVLGVVVNDLDEIEIYSLEQVQDLIEYGNQRRMIAETKANEFSSRSHAIVLITIERRTQEGIYAAKLSLVDLAGSERQSVHSETRGIRTFEGSNINRSLLTLGNCIMMLSDKKKGFIPYRDSKLTRLLKDSLGGNTKTVMIACVSPSLVCYEETVNTLKYACRANKIEKSVHQNLRENRGPQQFKKEISQLKKQNQLLKMGALIHQSDARRKKQTVFGLLRDLVEAVERRTLDPNYSTQAEDSIIHSILNELDNQNPKSQVVERITCKLEGFGLGKQTSVYKEPVAQKEVLKKSKPQKEVSGRFVKLQELRRQVMQDKEAFKQFKRQLEEGTLSPAQIQSRALDILELQRCSSLSLHQSERQYLQKLSRGANPGLLDFSATIAQFTPQVLGAIQQNIQNSSHNRHLESLQRILLRGGTLKGNWASVESQDPECLFDDPASLGRYPKDSIYIEDIEEEEYF